jgi:hypothetical protein
VNDTQKESVRNRLIVLVAAGITLLLAGCASTPKHLRWYDGPPFETNNIALLKIYENPVHNLALVRVIDGVPIDKGKQFAINNTREIELLPGNHSLEIFYMDTNGGHSISNAVLSFTCEPGHVYELHVAPIHREFGAVMNTMLIGGRYNWTTWIVDTGSRKIVAGQDREEPLHWYE